MISYYLPEKSSSIAVLGKNVKILGYSKVILDIERLRGEFSVWVDTVDGKIFVSSDTFVRDVIYMSSTDLDMEGYYIIDNRSVSCKFLKLVYNSIHHAYLITFEFPMKKEHVSDNIHTKAKKQDDKGEFNRFKMMDFE